MKPRLCSEQLARCLVYHESDDSTETIYEGIQEFEPATSMTICLRSGRERTERYWSLDGIDLAPMGDLEALDRFEEVVETAAAQWTRSDRGFAMTLSGGVDSSVVALALSRVGLTGLRAYTSSFPGQQEFDETHYAKLVADALGLDHRCVEPDLEDLELVNRKLAWHQELLYGSGSVLLNWCVTKRIKADGVVPYLTGQGGDEVFLGYERYFGPSIWGQRHDPVAMIKQIAHTTKNSKLSLKDLLVNFFYFRMGKLRETRYRRRAKRIYSNELIGALRSRVESMPLDVRELQKGEICGRQLRHLLRFDDRASSSHGLEVRPMLLDHRLVELGYAMDVRHKFRDGWSKYIMRKYLERHGLKEIAWRTHKMGYPAPSEDWVRSWKKEHQLREMSGIVKPGLQWSEVPEEQSFMLHNLFETAQSLSWKLEKIS